MLSVTAGGQALPAQVTQGPVEVPGAQAGAPPTAEVAPDGSLRLPGLARRDGLLGLYEGPLYPIDSTDASFAGEDWTVRLREWSAPMAVAPGQPLTVLLFWQAARPAPKDYEVFLELRDATGVTVAATSGQPAWFTPRPASAWQVKSDGLAGVIDAHSLQVPAGLDPGSVRRGRRLAGPGGGQAAVTGGRVREPGGRRVRPGGGDRGPAGRAAARCLLRCSEGMLCLERIAGS